MAQKALKTLAARNTQILNRLHLTSLIINAVYLLIAFLLSRRSLVTYVLLNSPALFIQFWFERSSRPQTNSDGSFRTAGSDLEAKGLTEWMWDVLYWTWVCVGSVAIGGDRAWWLWSAVPLYSAYLAWTAFSGARKGFAGMGGAGMVGADGGGVEGVASGQSKRQAKMEKRGGQKVAYGR